MARCASLNRHLSIFLLALAGCDRLLDPQLPEDAEAFVPPPVYARWWKMIASCSGITLPLGDVSWYVTSRGTGLTVEGKEASGYWSSASNRIVLAHYLQFDGDVVRHEMLHAVVRENGHPRKYFLERCAGLVICEQACVDQQTQPVIDPALPRISPQDFEVGLELEPSQPSLAIDDGFFTVTVKAHNSTGHAVVAAFPKASLKNPATSFALELIAPAFHTQNFARALLVDSGTIIFRKDETKRYVFDVSINGSVHRSPLEPGSYTFQGRFGDHWVNSEPVVIAR